MSRFTAHLGLWLFEDDAGRPIMREGRTQWFVTGPLVYEVGAEGSGETITVEPFDPTGKTYLEIVALLVLKRVFITDLGSIPSIAWSLGLSPSGAAAKAFVIHDRIYAVKGARVGVRLDPGGGRLAVSYTRAEADRILDEAMKVCGVPAWKRFLIYRAVRLGGGKGWGS
jgi:hypothetical protein